MIIAIDLTSISFHITGIERYALCVSEKLIQNDSINQYILIFRDEIYKNFKVLIDNIRIRAITLHGNSKLLFYQIILPIALYRIKADKYVFLAFSSPILFYKKGIFNTIHDMGAWDASFTMKKRQQLYFRITYSISAKFSEKVFTVSEFSKYRICKILKMKQEKVKVVYSAPSDNLLHSRRIQYDDVKRKYKLPPKYIMSLSTLEPRKNLSLLLESYVEIMDNVDYDLVLVGRIGWKMDEMIQLYGAQKRIHLTGYIDDDDVVEIYKNTLCFIFPTLYEGFGLPPIEALALGAPVISSDAASMPEILMNQAIFFKNNDKSELKKLLINLEINIKTMPRGLNEFQKDNFTFDVAANKILNFLS